MPYTIDDFKREHPKDIVDRFLSHNKSPDHQVDLERFVSCAFCWGDTNDGGGFWHSVSKGNKRIPSQTHSSIRRNVMFKVGDICHLNQSGVLYANENTSKLIKKDGAKSVFVRIIEDKNMEGKYKCHLYTSLKDAKNCTNKLDHNHGSQRFKDEHLVPVSQEPAKSPALKPKESDRKEVAKAIREILECLNGSMVDADIVGLDVKFKTDGRKVEAEITYTPPTPDKRVY